MHPILFEIFGYPIRFYGLAMAMAFIFNIALAYRRCSVEKLDRDVVINTTLWVVIGTLVGGRLLFAFTQWEEFVTSPKKLISFWEGGLVFYGGFIGSYIAAMGYLLWVNMKKKQRTRFLIMLIGITLVIGYITSGVRILKGNPIGEGVLHYLAFWNYNVHHSAGFIASFVIVFVYWSWHTRKQERFHTILPIFDLLSPYVGLGLAIHRTFGCFLNGCCYGRPTDFPWGVQFPLTHVGTKFYGITAHLHPTQIYEALNGMTIFFVLIWFRKRKKVDGEVTAWLLMIYAINRYLIEFFRGDRLRGDLGEPTSLAVFVLGFVVVSAALFAILVSARKRGIASGVAPADDPKKVFSFFGFGVGIMIILTIIGEMLRPDPTLATIGPISTSQFIGYLTFIAGYVTYVTLHYLGKRLDPLPKNAT